MTTIIRTDNPDATGADALVGADRVLAILVELAAHHEGIGLDELARTVNSAKPTVHRALAALRRAGLAVQDSRGHYVLGDEFIRMAYAYNEARPDHVRVQPILVELANRYLETAHYAVLDGSSVVYRGKVDPPRGAMKLTSTVGGRNPAYRTAVGKLLLSYALPDEAAVHHWAKGLAFEARTPNTLTTVSQLHQEFERIRLQGYSVDNQENELQVNCVAVPLFLTSPTVPTGAISVSAIAYRTPLASLIEAVPEIQALVTTGE